MRSICLVIPVWKRYALTRIMLENLKNTFYFCQARNVMAHAVVIGDDANLDVATDLDFSAIESENLLGKKYSDGHQFAVESGFDVSLHCNSDQAFNFDLLCRMANAPDDKIIQSHYLTAIHKSGERAISYRNPVWAFNAFPTKLLANNPRPVPDHVLRNCDTASVRGVCEANPNVGTFDVRGGYFDAIQFESDNQMTPWERHVMVASKTNSGHEDGVPWDAIELIHGKWFLSSIIQFYESRKVELVSE